MILVLAEDYPSKIEKYAMAFIHTRNLFYKKNGIEVTVLNFNAEESYIFEGIKVISFNDYKQLYSSTEINLLISHAPNLKHHVSFIMKYYKKINKVIMVFHGHEVLKISKYYPKPYSFITKQKQKEIIRNTYDSLKLPLMRFIIKKLIRKNILSMFFVSEWIKEHCFINLNIKSSDINEISFVIPNSIHPSFIKKSFKYEETNKIGDFVVIRPLDNPKYGIDIVRSLALKFPQLSFHIYGKGDFFNHYTKPENITLFDKYLSQSEMPEILNQYRAALMPTRLDAQGVMMCEMATFGIPIVTSDIPICTEMLSGFENAFYFNNEILNVNLKEVLNFRPSHYAKNLKFADVNTVAIEAILIEKIMGGNK